MKKELELYIHIPFCVQKCHYCDFLSAPCDKGLREAYVKSLCRKICSYQELAKAYHVVSIFFGGGTPSVLEVDQTRSILVAIKETFEIDVNAEITTELNPGTVTEEKLCAYKEMGINRLSIGLQSVKDQELRLLGRIHTFEEFKKTYQMAREIGFDNLNIDLISAIPGQTVESWRETLETVALLLPEHISAYSLIIEEGTRFYELYGETGSQNHTEAVLPDEESERKMYQDTKNILEKYGYHRYEISNYAQIGYECKHNLGYWERRDYLGIGLGAASLMDNVRWNETSEMEEFLLSELPMRTGKEALDRIEQMEEFMFLGLRKTTGVSKIKFFEIFGKTMEEVYGAEIERLCGQGLLELGGDLVKLTEHGIDVSNYVMSEFIK